jgi:hypothetical protein
LNLPPFAYTTFREKPEMVWDEALLKTQKPAALSKFDRAAG